MLLLLLATVFAAEPTLPPLPVDPAWQVLPGLEDRRATLLEAGERLGDWQIQLAGVDLDGAVLTELARTVTDPKLTRSVREALRQPFDVDDLLRFLDDVLLAGENGRRGEPFYVSSGRARSAGILVHPDDVWKHKPRRYGRDEQLHVDKPAPQASHPPAVDGDPPGPDWTMRFVNPATRAALLEVLAEKNPDFSTRVADLMGQLERQGATVWLNSTVRSQERGYLMWGAFILGRCGTAACVESTIATLRDRHRAWSLDAPIRWHHPDGWKATAEGARQMADAYSVVYATERGARSSSHYGSSAVDFTAVGLPRSLTLTAPDGETAVFDLHAPEEPRDLSLTPEVVHWIEAHWHVSKLKGDYPHWSDTK